MPTTGTCCWALISSKEDIKACTTLKTTYIYYNTDARHKLQLILLWKLNIVTSNTVRLSLSRLRCRCVC